MSHKVNATRAGEWWKLTDSQDSNLTTLVPSIAQGRRTFAALLSSVKGQSVKAEDVEISMELPANLKALSQQIAQAEKEAAAAQERLTEQRRTFGRELMAAGYTQRDAAAALNMSAPTLGKLISQGNNTAKASASVKAPQEGAEAAETAAEADKGE